jgi:hypothetical protein
VPTSAIANLIEGPGGGVITHRDPRHVPDQAWANCRNVRFPTGGSRIRKTDGYTRLDNTTPAEPIRAIYFYQQVTAVPPVGQAFIRVGLTRAWAHFGANLPVITPPTYKPCTVDQVVTITGYKNFVIWADGGANPVMFWDGAGTGTAAALFPGGTPNGKLVEIHKDRLLLGNITEPGAGVTTTQPWRVMYSDVGHPENMTSDLAGDIDFLEDTDPLTAIKVLGDAAIVHKPSRIFRMIAIGGPDVYQIEQIPADDGAISARSPISIGSYQFFMGRANIYRLAAFTEPIGDAVWPEIEKNTDWSQVHRIYAYRRQEYDEVCWKIPQLGGGDLSVAFNYRDQSWTFTDHDPGTCYTEIPQVPWLTPTAVSHLPLMVGVFGQMTGHIQAYDTVNADGAPIHAWAESKHFQAGLIPVKILAIPLFATGTGVLRVQLRAAMEARHPLPPWPTVPHSSALYQLLPSQTRPWIDVRAYGRLYQIRVESSGLDDDWALVSYGAAIVPGGYAR